MPHIFFLGNCLFRMYEIHTHYNCMFPLHILFFHLRLRPYASAKQGYACLACTSSFPVHVAMSVLTARITLSSSSVLVPRNASFSDPKRCQLTAPDQDWGGEAQSNQIWLLPTAFVTCVRHRRHFHRQLQRCYLSDDRVLTHMCAINISVATSQFSHCYLYSGIKKKKCGALLYEQTS